MKNNLFSILFLGALLISCAPKSEPIPPTPDINAVVGTMMAATLTAVAPTPIPPTSTPAPEPTATPLPPGTIVEDFNPGFIFPNSDWSEPYQSTNPTDKVYSIDVIPDYLQIHLPDPETFVYTFFQKEMPANVEIESAYFLDGKRNSEAAVVCRVDPTTRTKWYEFRINHFDKSGVIYYFDRVDVYRNPYQRLAAAYLPVELFSDQDNRIRAVCSGNTLTLYLNGEKVTSVEDTQITGGGLVGVGGFAHNQVPLNVNFNYFYVKPSE